MDERTTASGRDQGFTLVELLVVIVVLAIVATVTVFAVRGIVDRGEESACAQDQRLLTTALEAQMAEHGVYADEPTIMANGLLHAESELHEVTVAAGGTSYSITGIGLCAPAPSPTVPATVPAPGPATTAPAPVTTVAAPVAPFSTRTYGTGTAGTLLVFGYGAANGQTQAMLESLVASGDPVLTTYTAVWVDTGGRTTVRIDELETILSASSFDEVFFHRGYDSRYLFAADGASYYSGSPVTVFNYMTSRYGAAAHSLRQSGFVLNP